LINDWREEQCGWQRFVYKKTLKEKIYANDRLAYTEITMDIACAEKVGVIRGYIFVSTSEQYTLSLWVNGIERKEF
jgi:hypothetical protein